MAAPLERNASVPMRTSSREGVESFRSHLGRPESGLSIMEAAKSSSLQDNQVSYCIEKPDIPTGWNSHSAP